MPGIPGRALFSYTGQSAEPLSAYPTADLPVFEFERPLPNAVAALRERLLLPAQPLRLLKIRADGSAFEIAGRHVRSNQSYLLVAAHAFADGIVQSLALSPAQTSTAAAHLWRIDVPQALSAAQIASLKALRLGYVLAVRMEPLGLSPRWDPANGALEFLDTETAMFSLSSDIAVREFLLSIDGEAPVRVKPGDAGTTLITLGSLPVGPHRMCVSALGAGTGADIEADEITLVVRPSMPWQTAIAGKAGVTFALEPREATLEQLFDGTALIRVRAPEGRKVKLDGRFFAADGTLFHDEAFGRYVAPIADNRLSDSVVQKLTSDAQAERLERAARIELAISLDEYGSEVIAFEKDAEPLRWVRVDEKTIRLSDDSASDTAPTVKCYDLDAVEVGRVVEYQQALDGIELRCKGGLLVAKHNKRRYEAIATVIRPQLMTFSDLGVPASVVGTKLRPATVINALKLWHAARRLMGPMAFMARRNAVHALEERLELLLCGKDWIAATKAVRSGEQNIDILYGRVFYSRGFAAGLRTFNWRYEADEGAAITEFLRLATRVYKVSDNEPLCRLALRLAFRPSSISPSDLPADDAFDVLKANFPLIRGAYFARLAADMRAHSAAWEAA